MALDTGTRLSGYQILGPLGAGGMGQVYLARDLRLDRQVAIKALPEPFAEDRQRLLRFEREARILASLNHPNIATLYALEEIDGRSYLVLELVPGESVAERLLRGPLDLRTALAVGEQVAAALEAAHEAGVVHRDLKPGNVMLQPNGRVKVLDFGLAKGPHRAADGEPSGQVTEGLTREGVVVGTVAYMSPEQARGLAVDRRTDIWAFGCLLFECLTGELAFAGATWPDMLVSILQREPRWEALPADLPAAVLDLVERCLDKDPRYRLRDVGEARITLERAQLALGSGVSRRSTAGPAGEPARPRRRPRRPWLLPLLALLVGAAAATLAGRWLARREPPPVRHFEVTLPPGEPLQVGDNVSLALSPDGSRLVVVTRAEGEPSHLWLRPLAAAAARPLPGTEGAQGPFFSPDGEWVAFFDYTNGALKRVPVRGGPSEVICPAPPFSRGGTWGEDGQIVFTRSYNTGLWWVPATGGEPRPLTSLDPGRREKTHRFPQALPGGRGVLFMIGTATMSSWDDGRIAVLDSETGKVRVLVEGGLQPRYAKSGHLIYARAGTLLAVPFDLERLEVTGLPVEVLRGVITSPNHAPAQYAVGDDGTLAYAPGDQRFYYGRLEWVAPDGGRSPLGLPDRSWVHTRVAPRGDLVAIGVSGANEEVWIYDRERRTFSRLSRGWDNYSAVWLPDGREVVYASTRGGGPGHDLWRQAAEVGSSPTPLYRNRYQKIPTDTSPSGRFVAYTESHPDTGLDLWLLPLAGGPPRPFRVTPDEELDLSFAPDETLVAYTSNETGRDEVYAQELGPPGRRWQVSGNGGSAPVWGGDALYFQNEDRLLAAPRRVGAASPLGPPRLLFTLPVARQASAYRLYDLDRATGHFLVPLRGEHGSRPTVVAVVTDWFAELRRLAG